MISPQEKNGQTLIELAKRKKNPLIVDMLLKINFFSIIQKNNTAGLLEHKADVTAVTNLGTTALELAKIGKREKGNFKDLKYNECIALLKAAKPSLSKNLLRFFHSALSKPTSSAPHNADSDNGMAAKLG